jgi:3-hydroxymyristoyl/3-hydroxydecanoyl-(acyl carrier protein) dehydratase
MQVFDLDHRPVRLPDADKSFPRVLSLTGDESQVFVQLDISPDLDWFRGHFPDQPVLPGVVQLHWAVLVAQACYDLTAAPKEIKRLKFKNIVTPPQLLELTVSLQGSDEVQFDFSHSGARFSEGRLIFTASPAC